MQNSGYKRIVLSMLLVVYVLNFVDRQILSLLMEPIKQDLMLSDTELGFMSGIAFAIFYTLLGIPIAKFADKGHRVNIICAALATWSAMTVVSGMALNFWQLVLARIGVGIGEAGCTPPAHSLIADYFPRQERSRAIAVYMMGVPLGILVGFLAGGWINELYGWRIAFIALGLPGLFVALVAKLTIREPNRGQFDKYDNRDSPSLSLLRTLRYLWSISSFRYLVAGVALTSFVGSGVGQWHAVFFIRNHEMNTGELGVWLAMMSGLCGAIGIFLGGYLSQRFAGKNESLQLKIILLGTLLMILPGIASLIAVNKYIALSSVGMLSALYFLHYGPCYALILSLAPSHMRAMASAITLLVVNLIGLGLGPQVVGLISDLLAPSFGDQALRVSLISIFFVIFLASYSFWMASRALKKDLMDLDNRLNTASDPQPSA